MTIHIDFTQGVNATSYGLGPFHPAIQNGSRIWYWPNITFDNENEACERALICLSDACIKFIEHTDQWNVFEAETGR